VNIFEQYGIKEVADVALFSIHRKNNNGDIYHVPALFLDTLKISSFDKGAGTSWAEGGKGHKKYIGWDHNKQIRVHLEDALCSPASLGLCWGGVLNADWVNSKIQKEHGVEDSVERIFRTEKIRFINRPKDKSFISYFLPRNENDTIESFNNYLVRSTITDNVKIKGWGKILDRVYQWRVFIDSGTRTLHTIPDRFFDVNGNTFYIISNPFLINSNTLEQNQFNLVYKINPFSTSEEIKDLYEAGGEIINEDLNEAYVVPPQDKKEIMDISKAKYLCVNIKQDNIYEFYISNNGTSWYYPEVDIIDTLFKELDLSLVFSGLNELNYFLITKYKDNILSIDGGKNYLWAYLDAKTLKPFPDDYWFSEDEVYMKAALTLSSYKKKIKAKRIRINSGVFPGVYSLKGQALIRNKETGEDEFMLIHIPACKVSSEQSLELSADGDAVVFNLDLEVIPQKNGVMMELIPYEISKENQLDNSTQILVGGE